MPIRPATSGATPTPPNTPNPAARLGAAQALPAVWPAVLLALAAGAGTVLAFAPFGWWPLQIATLALAFQLALVQRTIKRSVLVGWAYGFGWTVCGVYWLFISMHRYGGMPAWMAALAVGLMGVAMGFFAALALGAGSWLRQRWVASPALHLLLILPAVWTLSEWARGWVFTGFPWVVSGYAHTASPLAGFAALAGVYGVGWVAACMAGCLAYAVHGWRNKNIRFALLALVAGLLFLGLGMGLKSVNWTSKNGQPISVRLLQGNIPQEIKFERDHILSTLALYRDMIEAAPADLIATPETALPLFIHQLPADYLALLADFAQRSGSFLALGVSINDAPLQYTNSVLGIAPVALASPAQVGALPALYRYDKHHLVPFGEFVPTGFRWFVDLMRIPLGDSTRGARLQAPFALKDQWILPNICYEDLFGEEIADQLAALHYAGAPQAGILLNLSNIAWFGDTIAVPQHLQISQMRTLETGRPMLRATNTGATAVINAKGEVMAQVAPFTRATLAATVQGMRGNTPYILYGNSIMLGLALLMLASARFLSWRINNRPDQAHEPIKTR